MLKGFSTKCLLPVFIVVLVAVSPLLYGQAAKKATAAAPEKVSQFQFKTIVIDAGHGGKDPGAHGAFSNEKTIALSIARKLKDAIIDAMPGINVVMTRSTDKFIELHRRAEIANETKANLFISIHCNSTPQKKGTRSGALLLVYGFHRKQEQLEAIRENASIYKEKDYKKKYNGYGEDAAVNAIVLAAFQQRYRKQSIHFGNLVDDEFTGTDSRRSAGVHEQGLLVLQQSGMPGILIETGFINNPSDEKYLNSVQGQGEIVKSVVKAIGKYKAGL